VAWVSGSREEARATDRRHLFPATRDEKPKRTEQTLSFFLAFGKRFSYFFLSFFFFFFFLPGAQAS